LQDKVNIDLIRSDKELSAFLEQELESRKRDTSKEKESGLFENFLKNVASDEVLSNVEEVLEAGPQAVEQAAPPFKRKRDQKAEQKKRACLDAMLREDAKPAAFAKRFGLPKQSVYALRKEVRSLVHKA